jgi:penicillin-binding protein 2B
MIEEITAYSKLTEESLVHDKVHTSTTMDNYVNMKTSDVISKLKNTKVNYHVLGDGEYVINQYPSKGSKIFEESTNVFVLTNSQDFVMPDLRGLSSGDVKILFSLLDIKYHLTGSGVVVSQSIEPGEKIPLDATINLELGSEYVPTIEDIVETEIKEEKEKE